MYKYELWYGCQLLHEEDGFDTEEEAREEGEAEKYSRMAEYEIDGAEYDETEFNVEVEEV